MKKIKVSILALSVLVGGAVFASAANTAILGATADVALTNAPTPLVWYGVSDIPTSILLNPDRGVSFEASVVDTDNSGKIAGAGNIVKRYYDSTDTNKVVAISSWYTTVKGNINAQTMATPTIKLTLKGDGYLALGTNLTLISPSQNNDAFPGKFSLNFTANKVKALPIRTNEFEGVVYAVAGNLKGSITPAAKGAKTQKVDEAATLVVNRNSLETINLRVILSGTKFAAILWNTDATGTGKIDKNNKYTLNLKSVAGGNSSLQLKGDIVAVTQSPFTNITTINTADVKGKIQGQAVQSTGYKFRGLID